MKTAKVIQSIQCIKSLARYVHGIGRRWLRKIKFYYLESIIIKAQFILIICIIFFSRTVHSLQCEFWYITHTFILQIK